MKPLFEITLIEMDEPKKDPWYREFAVLIDAGKGKTQKLMFCTYPDWWEVYIKLPISDYDYYYN